MHQFVCSFFDDVLMCYESPTILIQYFALIKEFTKSKIRRRNKCKVKDMHVSFVIISTGKLEINIVTLNDTTSTIT